MAKPRMNSISEKGEASSTRERRTSVPSKPVVEKKGTPLTRRRSVANIDTSSVVPKKIFPRKVSDVKIKDEGKKKKSDDYDSVMKPRKDLGIEHPKPISPKPAENKAVLAPDPDPAVTETDKEKIETPVVDTTIIPSEEVIRSQVEEVTSHVEEITSQVGEVTSQVEEITTGKVEEVTSQVEEVTSQVEEVTIQVEEITSQVEEHELTVNKPEEVPVKDDQVVDDVSENIVTVSEVPPETKDLVEEITPEVMKQDAPMLKETPINTFDTSTKPTPNPEEEKVVIMTEALEGPLEDKAISYPVEKGIPNLEDPDCSMEIALQLDPVHRAGLFSDDEDDVIDISTPVLIRQGPIPSVVVEEVDEISKPDESPLEPEEMVEAVKEEEDMEEDGLETILETSKETAHERSIEGAAEVGSVESNRELESEAESIVPEIKIGEPEVADEVFTEEAVSGIFMIVLVVTLV